MMSSSIIEPSRHTPIWGEFDIVVLGGGPAGIAAATSAARSGKSTLLIERYGFLGGMGTAAGVTNFCGLHANIYGEIQQVVHGVVDDLLARMQALGGLNTPHIIFGGKMAAQAYDNAVFKITADELVLASGAQLLFHAQAVGVMMRQSHEIDALLIETKSGRFAVKAHMFIDCSGDGDLAALAGAPFEKGKHHNAQGERVGEDMMYPSTMFRLNGVDAVRAGDAWNHFEKWMEVAEKNGHRFPRKSPIIRPQKNPSEWRANVTQLANADGSPVDGTQAQQLSRAEIEGRKQIVEFLSFLHQYVPGFEQAYLLEIAPQVGIRETRRMRGEYQLNETDVLSCASFNDSIGVNGWMIEEHVAGNIAFKWQNIPHCRGFNHLPYRMLLPLKVDNLWVAGRCASMTHKGQSAARVSGACFVMGQAAGTAAAMALSQTQATTPSHALPEQIATSQAKTARARFLSITALQSRLEADGVYLGRDVI